MHKNNQIGAGIHMHYFYHRRSFQDAFHAMKPYVIKIRPDLDDPVRCEKFLQECAEECKEYKTSVYLIRCYGQKPSTTSD